MLAIDKVNCFDFVIFFFFSSCLRLSARVWEKKLAKISHCICIAAISIAVNIDTVQSWSLTMILIEFTIKEATLDGRSL